MCLLYSHLHCPWFHLCTRILKILRTQKSIKKKVKLLLISALKDNVLTVCYISFQYFFFLYTHIHTRRIGHAVALSLLCLFIMYKEGLSQFPKWCFASSLFHITIAINVYNPFMYHALCLKQLFVNTFVAFSMLQWIRILVIIVSCTCLFTPNTSLQWKFWIFWHIAKLPLQKWYQFILLFHFCQFHCTQTWISL